MKNITLQWWNFLIVFFVIFLLGVLIGLMVVPHPSKAEEDVSAKQILSGKVDTTEEIEPIRTEGDIIQSKLIEKVEPVYPEIARQAGVEGVVICEATTDVYGRVMRVKVLKSIPLLDQAAIDAIKQWVYEPMTITASPRELSSPSLSDSNWMMMKKKRGVETNQYPNF